MLVGGDVVTMNRARDVLRGGAVVLDGERIVAVGSTTALLDAHPDATIVDVAGCVVTPGMIDAHQHLTGDPLVRCCIPDLLPSGAAIFDWSVPIHDAHETPRRRGVGHGRRGRGGAQRCDHGGRSRHRRGR